MKKKKVAIFTGNRAEYGLQYPVIKAISENKYLIYDLLVSGAHLDKKFGNTLNEIKQDGFNISKEIKIPLLGDSLFDTTQAIGAGIKSISLALKKINPDIFIVYADRFEGFAAVVAGTQMNIPTAHIEGGDITEGGALDDSIRHAMTKLSHLHFTTNKFATKRILAMGEENWRVKTVGFPGVDLIKQKKFMKKEEIKKNLKLDFKKPIIIFTQHSVTTEFNESTKQIQQSLIAIKKLLLENVQVIVTFPNNDAGGKKIINEIVKWKNNNDSFKNLIIKKSLGSNLYYGVLNLAKSKKIRIACAGNSSSGIKETAVFGCPTVNIGTRQKSRLRGSNVLDANYAHKEIYSAIKKCLYDDRFRNKAFHTDNPYGTGNAGKKIADFISKVKLDKKLVQKKMTIKFK
ncbi:MAG: UDP-N-acetylglucosamine 2-epimerase (hydrolyzing) [Alphaproteobacteria bacterium TMED62]|nr:MAG: UDP-N-acetylglucosamine 2-epimerase (hydrolyzing) [Alphaproteobacteria bacterium TMED62]|tara:strand:+ start:4637 stop:5842 length:1206 start_codon:yes stop_codon:yes gene_type:complete